jgi:predicted DNA-binding transcriptional regulator AlpA
MLDVHGLAELLGYSPLTVRRYAAVSPGKLPPRMDIPGRMIWSVNVVDAWLSKRTPELAATSPMDTAPAPSQCLDLSTAFGIKATAPVPAKAPRRGRPRGSKSIK